MNEHEINWISLIQAALLLGLLELAAEIAGLWGRFPFRPDWFWCLALFASLKTTPIQAIMTFALCGTARDLLIGPRIGAGAIAFIGIGWLALQWDRIAVSQSWLHQVLAAGLGAFAAACLRLALEVGRSFPAIWDGFIIIAMGQGALTLAAYVPSALFFSLSPLQLRRERRGYL